jgi:hypothetical protein
MQAKKALAAIVGITQSTIGIAAIILAFLLYSDFFSFRLMLNVSEELLPFNLWVLVAFGLFSLLNGFFLFYES